MQWLVSLSTLWLYFSERQNNLLSEQNYTFLKTPKSFILWFHSLPDQTHKAAEGPNFVRPYHLIADLNLMLYSLACHGLCLTFLRVTLINFSRLHSFSCKTFVLLHLINCKQFGTIVLFLSEIYPEWKFLYQLKNDHTKIYLENVKSIIGERISRPPFWCNLITFGRLKGLNLQGLLWQVIWGAWRAQLAALRIFLP